MKKQIKYELCLLAVANAGVSVVMAANTIGDKRLREDIELASRMVLTALGGWPGADARALRWARRRLKEWQRELAGRDDGMAMGALIAASYQALVDLETMPNLTDDKRAVVRSIIKPVARCSDFFHTAKSDVDVYGVACGMLQPLYELIGFRA